MLTSNPLLGRLLDDLIASGDVVLRARAQNFRFEERVGAARQAAPYETEHGPGVATYEDWLERHQDYLATQVFTELPETFLALNAGAALAPAVWSDLGAGQRLVRVESLDYAFGETKVRSLADLEHLLAIYRNERQDPHLNGGEAKALLQEVCDSLNRNPMAIRPRFAAFAQELAEDIDAAD